VDRMDGLILGAVMAAVSPAVVVPGMLALDSKGRGAGKRIPAMILGASALDNALVILLFTALMGVNTQAGAGLGSALIGAPEAMILGVAAGAAAGWLMCLAFEYFHPRATKMTLATLAVSILLMGLEQWLKPVAPMSGLLAVMAVGLLLLEKTEIRAKKISDKLAKLWIFAEILLFTLVGAQVDPSTAMQVGVMGMLVILAGLLARSLGVGLALAGTGLEPKEKLFCVVAFLPKATVQAAIGAVPLAAGMASGGVILAMAALAIVVTAPLGAIGIRLTGEKWLGLERPD
ncbi:MAG: cation:proton antiporter, partial [Nitrospinota bacterium]|nr:cation:proton antiporter [Nitrospinota bacterium]